MAFEGPQASNLEADDARAVAEKKRPKVQRGFESTLIREHRNISHGTLARLAIVATEELSKSLRELRFFRAPTAFLHT